MKLKTLLLLFLFLMAASVVAQNKGYKKGYIILEGERKQEGYIKYYVGSWTIFKSKPGKLKFKFTPQSKAIVAKDDVTGYVIESDSFAIHNNINVSDLASPFERDFVKVIAVGKINLFLHRCTSTTNTGVGVGPVGLNIKNGHGTWILKKGSRTLTIYNVKREKERLIRMVSDNKELAAELEDKKPFEINIEEVVLTYNSDSK